MAIALEIRERHRQLLGALLRIKIANENKVEGLDDEIKAIVSIMEQEDVAWVEKIYGVNAL